MLNQQELNLLLQGEANLFIAEIRTLIISTGANASGKTANSLESKIKSTKNFSTFTITGGQGFEYIERGRGATKRKGRGALRGIIRQWIDDKGITPDKGMTKDSLAFVITRAIHQRGTLLNLLGEVREIQSAVLTENRLDELYSNFGNLVQEQIINSILDFKI